MDSVQDSIRAKGMRSSHQRVRILDFLRTYGGHVPARRVYESLSSEMPSLSRTTVYNSLNALADKGLITAVRVPAGETYYEHTDRHHCHFFCTSCNSIIDTELTCTHLHTVESQGHRVHSVQGCFYGMCRECLSKTAGAGLPEVRNCPLEGGFG